MWHAGVDQFGGSFIADFISELFLRSLNTNIQIKTIAYLINRILVHQSINSPDLNIYFAEDLRCEGRFQQMLTVKIVGVWYREENSAVNNFYSY